MRANAERDAAIVVRAPGVSLQREGGAGGFHRGGAGVDGASETRAGTVRGDDDRIAGTRVRTRGRRCESDAKAGKRGRGDGDEDGILGERDGERGSV